MDAVKQFLLWLALKIRNAVIIYLTVTVLAYLIENMNKATETAQEVLSNPKTTGTIATAGSGTVLYDSFVDAAPDVLILLSILATILTIWAHLSARKRHKREDQLREARAKEESQLRQLEIENLRKEIAERDINVQELQVRAQAAELFYEHLKKNDPKVLEKIDEQDAERIIDFMKRKNG